MVSYSNFNLQMLQIVALRSQTVAGFRAKPKLLQTVHKLLQSVAEPKKDGGDGITFSRPGLACYPPLTVSTSLGVTLYGMAPG
jgi:hypothetical protein